MSTLALFDLDDTLLVTNAKINLRDPKTGEVIHRLSTNDYRDWKGQGKTQEYEADYEEFANLDKVIASFENATPALGLAILKDAIEEPNTEIGILTSRSSEKAVATALPKFLAKQGITANIDPNLIFAVGDPKYNFQSEKTDSELKLYIILKLIDENIFDSIFLVDDDPMHKKVIDEYCASHNIKNVQVYALA